MKDNENEPDDHRPILGDGERTVDGISPAPDVDGRARVAEHDPTNAWGERVVAGEGEYPGPEALADEAPDDTSTGGQKLEDLTDEQAHELDGAHGGGSHTGEWPGDE
jgi:hypothetical protein